MVSWLVFLGDLGEAGPAWLVYTVLGVKQRIGSHKLNPPGSLLPAA